MRIYFILLSFATLFLTGCITLTYTQTFERWGSSYVAQEIDMSRLVSGNEGYDARQLEEACANIAPGVSCSYDDGRLRIGKVFVPSADFYSFSSDNGFPYVHYTAEIGYLPGFNRTGPEAGGLASQTGQNKRLDDPALAAQIGQMKKSGMNITYIVEMPGNIIEAEGGEIIGNRAYFDVISVIGNGQIIKVVSSELNYLLIGGGILVLLFCLYVFSKISGMMKKPPEKQPKSAGIFEPKTETGRIKYIEA